MPAKKKIRIVLDTVLTAMIVAEMFIQYTGEFLHEVIGFAFFATVVIHLLLSAKWMKSTVGIAKAGKMTARRTALAVMGVLLAIAMIVLGVSSVAISGLLSSAGFVWTLGSYSMWATIHAFSSYALCALVTLHLAMHWAFLASAFKVPYDPSRRQAISTGVHAAAVVGAVALGVLAVQQVRPSAANAAAIGDGSSTSSDQENAFSEPVNDASDGSANAQSPTSKSSPSSKKKPGSSGSSASANPVEGNSGSGQSAPSSNDSEQGSSTASGICTLCRKQCPLSAPKCDKPYEAGLI